MSRSGLAQRLSRTQRRLLVVGAYLGLLSYAGMVLVMGNSPWLLLSLAGLLVAVIIHSWLLAPFTQRIADRKASSLDERQEAVRNRAHHSAYQILASVLIIVLVYSQLDLLHFEGALPSLDIDEGNVSTVLVAALWSLITLPTAIIAWNEPDPDDEGGA